MRKIIAGAAAIVAAAALAAVPALSSITRGGPPAPVHPVAAAAGYQPGWAGYVAYPAAGSTVAIVNTTFTVPTALPGDSIRDITGDPYQAALWAGIDGYGPGYRGVEQAGVWEITNSRTVAPIYELFWEMYPANPHFTFGGKRILVKPGDTITVDIYAPGENGEAPAAEYSLDVAVNGTTYSAAAPIAANATSTRHSAEVITEIPSHSSALDMGMVNYQFADFITRVPGDPKPAGPFPVTQHSLFQATETTPFGVEVIWPSAPSASDPVNSPTQLDAFSTNFYHLGR